MSKTIDFIFDFGSPNGYLAARVLPEIAARHNAEVNIIPCLLGGIFKLTGNQSPMAAFGNIKNKLTYDFLEVERFIKKHQLTRFKMNPHFPINTLMVMRGFIAAKKVSVGDRYFDTVLAAMWEDEKNMGDPAVVAEVLGAAGLDTEALFEMSQSDDVKETLKSNTADAVERGAFGVPTFFIGGEMFFGKDRLGQVQEALEC